MNGRQNSFLSGTVASRTPKISIHSGVDIVPSRFTPSIRRSGRKLFAPITYSGNATTRPNMDGLNMPARSVINSFRPVMQKAPTVNTRIFMEMT